MAQSTWSADAFTWTNTGNVWANVTYADSVALASNVTQTDSGLANYPSTATLASNYTYANIGGFSLVGEATLALSAGQTSAANAIYISSVTLGSTQSTSSTGNIVYVESITFANTLNIPLAGTTTWDLETATWASTSSSWGYSPSVALSVTASITQVMLSSLNAEDIEKIASALMPTDLGVSATVTLKIPVSGTLANEQDMRFNINFEETALLSATSGITSDNSFLWNDVAEDTGTTWTKVSDPDE